MNYCLRTDNIRGSPLYAYSYDANWQYLDKKELADAGSWSQGLIYDNSYYYVAFHTGNLEHGNLSVGIYDSSWTSLMEQTLTNYSASYNAMRPRITKVANLLYISYDVASYDVANHQEVKDWQCHEEKKQQKTEKQGSGKTGVSA